MNSSNFNLSIFAKLFFIFEISSKQISFTAPSSESKLQFSLSFDSIFSSKTRLNKSLNLSVSEFITKLFISSDDISSKFISSPLFFLF